MRRIMLSLISIIILFIVINCSRKSEADKISKGEKFRSVTMMNLNTDESEAELLKMINSYKIVFDELGHPNSMYQVWKERGDKKGKYKYIIEANWPNQEVYDKVHDSEKYKELDKKFKTKFDELVKESDYSRYILLNWNQKM